MLKIPLTPRQMAPIRRSTRIFPIYGQQLIIIHTTSTSGNANLLVPRCLPTFPGLMGTANVRVSKLSQLLVSNSKAFPCVALVENQGR